MSQRDFEELYEALDGVVEVTLLLPDIVRVLVNNKNLVVDWLKSKEFKERYANHPYPPLLNPENIDYKQISPELAWELNLPLPPYFNFLYLTSHGSGSTGMVSFLKKCNCSAIYCADIFDARSVYVSVYKEILEKASKGDENLFLFILDYVLRGDYQKYFALIPNKPALYLVRDPISALKSYLGMKRPAGGGAFFNLTCNPVDVIESRTAYGFVREQTKIPNVDEVPFWINYLPLCFHDTQLIEALINVKSDSIIYVDMQEILGDRASETMCNLAKKFGFLAPKKCDEKFFKHKVSDFGLGFPVTLYAHSSDLEKLQNGFSNDLSSCQLKGGISLTITTCYEIEQGQNDVTTAFFKEDITPIVITASAQDCQLLMQNLQLARVCSAYLKEFVAATFVKKDKEIEKRLKEEAVLEYFKEKPFFREKFYKILQKSLKHLQANRPDIIKTWKYYAEFLKICKKDSIC